MQAKQIHPAPPPQAWAPSDAQRACVAGELPRGATQRLVREALQQLRRTLLLVDSFRTQCELRSGVVELADLLQCVIVAWRDSFKFVDPLCPRAGEAAFTSARPACATSSRFCTDCAWGRRRRRAACSIRWTPC